MKQRTPSPPAFCFFRSALSHLPIDKKDFEAFEIVILNAAESHPDRLRRKSPNLRSGFTSAVAQPTRLILADRPRGTKSASRVLLHTRDAQQLSGCLIGD